MLGIGPLTILKNIERDTGKKVQEIFDCYAGTSTGSIISALLVTDHTAQDSFDIFKKNVRQIFTKYPIHKRVLPTRPTYDNKYLKQVLDREFGDIRFCDIKYPVFIPTTRMNGEKAVEKVWDNKDETHLRFGVLSSAAAPTYFDVVEKDGYSYCDGGMWANDATMVLQSGMKIRYPDDKLRVMVLNTGMSTPNTACGNKTLVGWVKYLIGDWIARTGNANCFEAMANLGRGNLLRVSPKIDKAIPLDAVNKLDEVIQIWENHYNEKKSEILGFLEKSL